MQNKDACPGKRHFHNISPGCCRLECEEIRDLVCIEIWLDFVVRALKGFQRGHTCKRQPDSVCLYWCKLTELVS
jgi:hypothetical protein